MDNNTKQLLTSNETFVRDYLSLKSINFSKDKLYSSSYSNPNKKSIISYTLDSSNHIAIYGGEDTRRSLFLKYLIMKLLFESKDKIVIIDYLNQFSYKILNLAYYYFAEFRSKKFIPLEIFKKRVFLSNNLLDNSQIIDFLSELNDNSYMLKNRTIVIINNCQFQKEDKVNLSAFNGVNVKIILTCQDLDDCLSNQDIKFQFLSDEIETEMYDYIEEKDEIEKNGDRLQVSINGFDIIVKTDFLKLQ